LTRARRLLTEENRLLTNESRLLELPNGHMVTAVTVTIILNSVIWMRWPPAGLSPVIRLPVTNILKNIWIIQKLFVSLPTDCNKTQNRI